ncbi:MAG: DUF4149 domain-containing protein [Candidatus Binatia bacterium]
MPPTGTEPRDTTFDTAETGSAVGVVAAPWIVSVFVASLALWVGAAVFLSAAVLPILFMNLEPSEAGKIAALVFPIYFQAGLVVGVVATACSLMLARAGGRRWQVVFAVVACMTLAQGWSALVIHPEMAGIRGVADQVARFQQLHVLSVRLNSVVLAGGMLLLGAAGFLLSPRRARA